MLFSAPDPALPGAACEQLSEEEKSWFYAEAGGLYKKAKAICQSCPDATRTECLARAMDLEARGLGVYDGKRFGVWGGLTGRERDRLARGAA